VALSNKQKSWIKKNKSKISLDKMSKDLKVSRDEIGEFLNSIVEKPVNKIYYLVLVLIPVLFFVLLETGLRIFNYGNDYPQWVNPIPGKYILNPEIARKYFHNIQSIPNSNQDIFDEVKKPNAFRIFVLGESSGAGYPYIPIGAFSRYIQQRLSLEYPESRIEVINCSMTAINTYTLRDLFPGILEQKPDLVLIYAGHNEYYGALGVGSIESIGTSRKLVNFVIYLERFKTFQFIRNMLKSGTGIFSSDNQAATGTLMSRMAQNQYIGLNSDIYRKGIDQFEGNMRDILEMAAKKNVPVILGTLACNLRDEYPFVSINEKGMPPADKIFLQAKQTLAGHNLQKADSLFRLAKDLDALRFRAPTDINKLILQFGKEYNAPVVNIDSVFDAMSPDNITGDNLMTDHLHPTFHGYQIIGDLFYSEMEKTNLLPKSKPLKLSNRQQDSITVANFPFSKVDSLIADYRIKLLKNDWPYIDKSKKIPEKLLLNPKDHIDSLVYDMLANKSNWEFVHRKAADWYLSKGDLKSFMKVMDVLISQYPIVLEYADYTVTSLLQLKDYDDAYNFLLKRNAYEQSAFSTKWLGIIDLYKNRLASSKNYLTQSLKFDENDLQVWYNLAGDYVNENNYSKALEMVSRAVSLKPDYREAAALQQQLQEAVKAK
jgi:tetratricopeptide (TPR) repeat protein